MAIKRGRSGSKVSASFSSSSMTDLVFLLLVFFVLATTLINPIQALQVTLPSSDAEGESDSPQATISVVLEDDKYKFILNSDKSRKYDSVDDLAVALDAHHKTSGTTEAMPVSLHTDGDYSMQTFVDVATIIQRLNSEYRNAGNAEDKYKLILAYDKK